MFLLESMEVRWFFAPDHAVVGAVGALFSGAKHEGPRLDRYVVTGRDDLGIKVRAEKGEPVKLETKYRIGSLGAVALAPKVTGVIDRWKKLSAELGEAGPGSSVATVDLEKERRLRRYASDASGVREVGPKDKPAAGCNVEWTELRVGGAQAAWTLAFESFGPGPGLLRTLQRVVTSVLVDAPELAVAEANARSYPAFVHARAQV
jgi:hypothetical protein